MTGAPIYSGGTAFTNATFSDVVTGDTVNVVGAGRFVTNTGAATVSVGEFLRQLRARYPGGEASTTPVVRPTPLLQMWDSVRANHLPFSLSRKHYSIQLSKATI
jgi:hypothetical protein